jgi:hypothetical protein
MSNSDQPHRIKGISFFASRHKKYAGKYIRGRWADQNELVRVPVEEQTGFGFKFDIMFGWTVRPIPMFWKLGWWKNKPTIGDIPEEEWDEFFGEYIAEKIRSLKALKNDGERPMKYAAYNPWYGRYWKVLRLPRWVPTFLISVNTPWKSIYFGWKSYRIDPFENDQTWTNKKDEERALFQEPKSLYYALAPSGSIRSHR